MCWPLGCPIAFKSLESDRWRKPSYFRHLSCVSLGVTELDSFLVLFALVFSTIKYDYGMTISQEY